MVGWSSRYLDWVELSRQLLIADESVQPYHWIEGGRRWCVIVLYLS